MIAVDTNVIVRLLTQDDEQQYNKSLKLFQEQDIFIPDTLPIFARLATQPETETRSHLADRGEVVQFGRSPVEAVQSFFSRSKHREVMTLTNLTRCLKQLLLG